MAYDRFTFSVYLIEHKELLYNDVIHKLDFDDIHTQQVGQLHYTTTYKISKNRNDVYIIKIYINDENLAQSFCKVYPLRHIAGMLYCPVDMNESQLDIGLIIFKEHIHEDIELNLCIPQIPPMPDFIPQLRRQ